MVLLLRYFSVYPNSLGRKEKKLYKVHIVHWLPSVTKKKRKKKLQQFKNWKTKFLQIYYDTFQGGEGEGWSDHQKQEKRRGQKGEID